MSVYAREVSFSLKKKRQRVNPFTSSSLFNHVITFINHAKHECDKYVNDLEYKTIKKKKKKKK